MRSKTKPFLVGLSFVTMLVIGFNNCSGVNFDVPTVEKGLSLPDGTLKFSYTVPFDNQPVDVLFVIDNSESMAVELANLGNRFSFFSEALKDKDWQACLVTTDWEIERGHLRQWRGADYVLSPQTSGFEEIFKETLNHITEETSGGISYYEHGIYSAYEAFGRAFTEADGGCFRAGAAKAVIIVSDEDEFGDGWTRPDGEQPQEGNKPENLIKRVKDVFGENTHFSAHAVAVPPGDEMCLDQQRVEGGVYDVSFGYEAIRYAELVNATQGVFVSICEEDYSASLAKIGQTITQGVAEIELPCSTEAVVDNVEVLNESQPNRNYSIFGNKVKFSPALVSGEHVNIFFSCNE